jgi:sensor histidine kinase YesM
MLTANMTAPMGLIRRSRSWLLYLGGWLLLALFFASQTVIYSRYAGHPASWRQALLYPLSDALPWSLLALVAFTLARRFPIERGRVLRGLAIHLPAALLLAVIEGVLAFLLLDAIGALKSATTTSRSMLGNLVIGKLHQNLITYAVLAGGAQTLEVYRRFRERERRAAQLEVRLAQARLEVLRIQLQPHFLFNTLHAISALMHRDVDGADAMLARLSDLLRIAIESGGEQEVPLKREVDFLAGYVEIQRARFGDRLRVSFDIPAATLDARVPGLFLQPLVENAIRHGIGTRAAGGAVMIATRREGEWLRLTVRDDGVGFASAAPVTGLGLANTRARLEALYGGAHEFTTTNPAEGGALVTLVIPWRPAAENGGPA